MNSDKMPLILDDAMPMQFDGMVDDLFGDDVALTMPIRPPSKQIHQRMDEQRNRGACRTVAWSRSGTIAYITPGGQELEFRCLRTNPEDGSWDLSEPRVSGIVRGSAANPLVHLDWAGTVHSELAVFDSTGRVALLIFSTALTTPISTRTWDNDPVDEMHTVVGSHWLQVSGVPPSQQAYNTMFGPATKVNNNYQYGNSFVHAMGPNHPHPSRSALFFVTATGTLKMLWMQMNNKMEEVSLELESVDSSEHLITHAAFASDKKSLILAIVTASNLLKYIKIEVKWGVQSGKSGQAQITRFNPELSVKHLAMTTLLPGGNFNVSIDASQAGISQLHVLPSVIDNSGQTTVPPALVAIRSRSPGSVPEQEPQTIFDRWEAVEQRKTLHPAMIALGGKRSSITELPMTTKLRKLETITLSKCLIDFQILYFGKVILLTFSDGSVQYRDRFTFDELYVEQNTTKILNLREVGWNFSDDGSCQQVAFSPTFCSMIQVGDDRKLRWNVLRYTGDDMGESMKDASYAASVACLTIAGASSIKYQSNFDDLLAIVQPLTSKPKFMQDWLTELIKIVTITVDYSGEHSNDALMKNDQLRNCLGIMVNFGFKGDMLPRSFQSTHAMLALHMRNIASEMTLASNMPLQVGGKRSPLDDSEVVEILASAIKWSVDLCAWIADSLFELMNDDEFMELLTPQRYSELGAYLHKKNNVSLHILICSSSRCFLGALCRRVAHLVALGQRAMEFYRRQSAAGDGNNTNVHLRSAYQKLQQSASASPINVVEFDKLVNNLGSGIGQAYDTFLPNMIRKSANPPQGKAEDDAVKVARMQLEAGMLLSAMPPPGFMLVLAKFFKVDVPAFRKLTDPAKLFFMDFNLLDAEEEPSSVRVKGVKSTHLDVTSKAPVTMSTGAKWRRCTRCTTVLADTEGKGPGVAFLVAQQRKCPCSGNWVEMPPGKLVP